MRLFGSIQFSMIPRKKNFIRRSCRRYEFCCTAQDLTRGFQDPSRSCGRLTRLYCVPASELELAMQKSWRHTRSDGFWGTSSPRQRIGRTTCGSIPRVFEIIAPRADFRAVLAPGKNVIAALRWDFSVTTESIVKAIRSTKATLGWRIPNTAQAIPARCLFDDDIRSIKLQSTDVVSVPR